MPTPRDSVIATFADDTAILAVANTEIESTQKLQNAVNEIAAWTTKWKKITPNLHTSISQPKKSHVHR